MTINPTISERIRQSVACNLQLSVHPSFLEKCLPKALHNFMALRHPRLKLKILTYLLHRLKLDPVSEELLHHPYRCFLSLSPQQWSIFTDRLGSLYFLEEIKTTVDHFKKRILVSLISEKGYNFIVHRGNLYTPILKNISVPHCSGELDQRIRNVGRFLLEYLWTQQPQPLLQRFVLNFNNTLMWNFQHIIDPHLQQQLFNICKHLLKETETVEKCLF